MQEMRVWSLGQEDPLDEKITTHSSTLDWKIIPWTEEPGRLQSLGLQRVRYNWAHTCIQALEYHYIIIQRRQWYPTPVLLPGKSHGRRILVGCSPWGRCGSDTTERLDFHFSLSCIGEGNGNPLQCSCLENPRDGGAWWAAVYGVTRVRHNWSDLAAAAAAAYYNNWHYSTTDSHNNDP